MGVTRVCGNAPEGWKHYPLRGLRLIDALDAESRDRDPIGSPGLLAAVAVLTIPDERMKASHFLA
jgi:hypothetical protein